MTGGQPVDGPLTPADIAQQVAAEGVTKIVVVTDEPDKYPAGYFAAGIEIHHRDDLDAVQRELRDTAGLHDPDLRPDLRRREAPPPQARQVPRSGEARRHQRARLRRLRRLRRQVELRVGRAGRDRVRPQAHDRPELVQQGLSPASTASARASSPSRAARCASRRRPKAGEFPALPDPALPATTEPYGILVTGIGGTGVVTIGALLGMAAHLEGKGCSVLDMTGLAQKNGAVVSHVRIADRPRTSTRRASPPATRSWSSRCDILTGVGYEQLAKMQKGVTKALVNTALVMPAGFTRDPDLAFPRGSMEREIEDAVAPGDAEFLDATKLATGLMGDSIATNLFMVGYAYQSGLMPLGEAAILRAIELNGAAVESNKQSFRWGRRAAVDPARVSAAAMPAADARVAAAVRVARRDRSSAARKFLTDYQDAAYAKRYTDFVAKVRVAESAQGARRDGADRSRRALLLQAARDQGRVRSRAPLHRDRFREARRRAVRGRLQAQVPPRAAAVQQARSGDRRGEEEHLRSVDDGRVPRAREDARACAARRSTSSAAPPSAGWSAR